MIYKIFKIFIWMAFSFSVLVVSVVVYYWFTYTDVTITEGGKYGFVIGESKQEAFLSVKSAFSKNNATYLFDEKNPYFQKITFTQSDYETLKQKDTWRLFFRPEFSDSISLRFDADNKLVEINRHIQYFELP